jgi:hypothetical protein
MSTTIQGRNGVGRWASRGIGATIERDPAAGGAALTELFRRHGTVGEVARRKKVAQSTVSRWLERLAELGQPDPRLEIEGARPPRPRRTALDEEAAADPAGVRRRLTRLLRPQDGEGARQARVRAAAELGVSEITVRRVLAKLTTTRKKS